jgi:hypothetical protein
MSRQVRLPRAEFNALCESFMMVASNATDTDGKRVIIHPAGVLEDTVAQVSGILRRAMSEYSGCRIGEFYDEEE